MKANTKIVQVFAELGTRDNFSDNKTDCLRQNIVHTVVCVMVCRAGHSRQP